MIDGLRIAADITLPAEYVTKTCAICAQRRKGKTYTAHVIAEELVRCGLPWVAFDPTGAWWGLRVGADGNPDSGLPVIIIGGDHGDLPLERYAGRLVADLVIDNPGWYIIDLSLLGSRAAEREFAADFAERLYRRKSGVDQRTPLHFFVDEADLFAPQEKETGDQRMLGAFQAIVRRGGILGLGCTLITQRPALLNKSVLTQLDLLILLRLIAGNDQDAVDKNYIRRAGSKEQRADLMDSMASLAIGEAWLWEPGAEPPLFHRTKIRERRTYNSSATPSLSKKKLEPTRLADVDLAELKEAMADAIERAEENDPAALHRKIAELRERVRELEQAPVQVKHEQIVREVVPPGLIEAAERLLHDWETSLDEMGSWAEGLAAMVEAVKREAPENTEPEVTSTLHEARRLDQPVRVSAPAKARARVVVPESNGAAKFGKREKAILSALAQFPQGRTQGQIALLTGYSKRASTIAAGLSGLRKLGYVGDSNTPAVITPEGLAALGEDFEPLPKGPALLQHWRSTLGKREVTLLDELVRAYPRAMDKMSMGEATGYSTDASTIDAGMSRLRGLGLVSGWRADDEFMEAIR